MELIHFCDFNGREQLGTAISEREKQSRVLKEEQKAVQEVQVNNQLQKQLWTQIQELVQEYFIRICCIIIVINILIFALFMSVG